MAKYRRKEIVEAIQWTGKNEVDVYNFLENEYAESSREVKLEGKNFIINFDRGGLLLKHDNDPTLKNTIDKVPVGDYIINTGISFYHIDPDQFKNKYEEECEIINTNSIAYFMKRINDIAKENSCRIELVPKSLGFVINLSKEGYSINNIYIKNELIIDDTYIDRIKYHINELNNNIQNSINITFFEAIKMCKQGKNISRRGWNNQFVFIITSEELQNTLGYSVASDSFVVSLNGQIQFGWIPTQSDICAKDWYVL